jgi:SAM-dependent methyltransferase
VTDRWANRDHLRSTQYKAGTNLAARVLGLAAPGPSGTVADVGCGNGTYLAELARRISSRRSWPPSQDSDGHYAIATHTGCLICES